MPNNRNHMFRRLIPLLAVLCLTAVAHAQTEAEKNDLEVLFVGNDPEAPKVPFADLAKPRTYALYRERTAAFEALLRVHFENVRIVHGADYTADMSDDFDVTIFDTRPKALTQAVREPVYKAATYLPESFDRPALMIADNSPRIGEPMGLKLDWL